MAAEIAHGQSPEQEESIVLHNDTPPSDKLYKVELKQQGDGWVVMGANARRGAALIPRPKTSGPVPYAKAKKVYDDTVRKKRADGYHDYDEGGGVASSTLPENSGRQSGIFPQLLNEVEEGGEEALITDDRWGAEEKFDGKRIILHFSGGAATGINRRGLTCGIPVTVERDALALGARFGGDSFLMDGELVGETFRAFDFLVRAQDDLRALPFARRRAHLELALASPLPNIALSTLARTTEEKRELYRRLFEAEREGVVFKRLDAPYTPGRPNRGGTQLKKKFVATGSFIVTEVNMQRSVAVHALDERGAVVPLGNVTIPANKDVPKVGDVVEVRYLYCHRNGGSLFQAVYLGVRDDITREDCRTSQLKYKSEDEGEDALAA